MKRSGPIQRRTELRRGDAPLPRTPISRRPRVSRQGSAALRASETILTASKRIVRERDGDACVRCGIHVPDGQGSVQHRSARGAGGSARRAEVVNAPGNLILCCGSATSPGCHNRMENTAEGRAEGKANGWVLPIGHPDPSSVPVLRFGRMVLIDNDGGVSLIA